MKRLYHFVISLMLLSGFLESYANTDKYRIMWRDNTSTSMVIGWNQISGSNPVVYYGTTDHGNNWSAYPNSRAAARAVIYKGMNNHFVRLTGLQADQAYYFVIKDSEGTSERFWFRTAPDDPSVRLSIIAGGDSRNNRIPRQNANKLVRKLRPHAVLFGGDMTDRGYDNEWREWFDDWQLTNGSDGRLIPIIAARGNHESTNNDIVNLFDVPSTNVYFALNMGGSLLRLYTLNTEISVSGNQATWLSNDLSSSSNVTWKIAQYHKPIRPHVSGKAEGTSQYSYWAPLFHTHKVNLVIECDAHTAKTTWPIRPDTGSGSSEGFIRDDATGTVYVGEGGWGAPLRNNDDEKPWTRNSGMLNQFNWIFIDQQKIEVRKIRTDNAEQVGTVADGNIFEAPLNLDVWNPNNGAVVTIKNTGSENSAPRVAITSPQDGANFMAPASITITTDASDVDGSITKVEFYNGANILGEDTSAPYSFTWNGVSGGNYSIIAKAVDNDGGSYADSTDISVTGGISCAGAGRISQEFWMGIPGTNISAIPIDTEPDVTHDLTIFEGPASSMADNYGSRIRGYICPPTSGEYIFWIAGDDHVELSLSTDDNPANKKRIAYHTGWTSRRQWTRYPTQQSAVITLVGNKPYYIEALMKEASGADHVSVGWQLPDGSLQRPIAGAHLIPFESSEPELSCVGTGSILLETWQGIDGLRVSSIPTNLPPTSTTERNIFEAPTNAGSNFGSRARGYICVPVTGNYTFWIAGDDHSELWLSSSADPAGKKRIAYHSGWTTPREWTRYATQQSAPIALVAGQQYYIEALYKEDEGGDNMAVGWQLPDGTMERPIPGNRLSRFEDAASTMAARTTSEANVYSEINVYPNPATSGERELTISGYEGIEKTVETDIEIMNISGEVVFTERIQCGGDCSSYPMNLNRALTPGVYVVTMKTNTKRYSKRLLVR